MPLCRSRFWTIFAVSLKPELFEGLRFDFTKGLNQKFSLSHRYLIPFSSTFVCFVSFSASHIVIISSIFLLFSVMNIFLIHLAVCSWDLPKSLLNLPKQLKFRLLTTSLEPTLLITPRYAVSTHLLS